MMTKITHYQPSFREQVLDVTIKAWSPVFAKTKNEVPGFVFDTFYPEGFETRQRQDVAQLLDEAPETIRVALRGDEVAGFVGLRMHPEDQMGEILIIVVAPAYQRQGIAKMLMAHAEQEIREAGMKMVTVETIGDSGHAPARRAYESQGYQSWPVARYFKPL